MCIFWGQWAYCSSYTGIGLSIIHCTVFDEDNRNFIVLLGVVNRISSRVLIPIEYIILLFRVGFRILFISSKNIEQYLRQEWVIECDHSVQCNDIGYTFLSGHYNKSKIRIKKTAVLLLFKIMPRAKCFFNSQLDILSSNFKFI